MKTFKLLEFKGITNGEVPVENVLNKAKDNDQVIVIGFTGDEISVATSMSVNIWEVVGILEEAKFYLLDIVRN